MKKEFIYKTSKNFGVRFDEKGHIIGGSTQEEMVKEINSEHDLIGTCVKVDCVL